MQSQPETADGGTAKEPAAQAASLSYSILCSGCNRRVEHEGRGVPDGWLCCELDRRPAQQPNMSGSNLTYLFFCSVECSDQWMRNATAWPEDNVNLPLEAEAAGGRAS
jgi:hypothetical protein